MNDTMLVCVTAWFCLSVWGFEDAAMAKNIHLGNQACDGGIIEIYEQPPDRRLRLYVKGMSLTKHTTTTLVVEPLLRSDRQEAEAMGQEAVGTHPYETNRVGETVHHTFDVPIVVRPGDALEVRCSGGQATISFHGCEGLTAACTSASRWFHRE